MKTLENTSHHPMYAHTDGYTLTQVELCKKLPPITKQFAKLRDENFERFKRETNKILDKLAVNGN